jgi:hypothetical protein
MLDRWDYLFAMDLLAGNLYTRGARASEHRGRERHLQRLPEDIQAHYHHNNHRHTHIAGLHLNHLEAQRRNDSPE